MRQMTMKKKDNFSSFVCKMQHFKNCCQPPNSTTTQLNHNSTQPQPKITLVGLDMKMTLHTPTTQTQNQQYLSCY